MQGDFTDGNIQDPKSKNTDETNFLASTNIECPDDGGRNAENGNVQNNVGHAATYIHHSVICRRGAVYPIATNRPYLE